MSHKSLSVKTNSFLSLHEETCNLTPDLLADLAEADSVDSTTSSHHASFPDVVSVEQQKAEGVSRVLSSWSSTDGELSESLANSS